MDQSYLKSELNQVYIMKKALLKDQDEDFLKKIETDYFSGIYG
jgi:hypothetical protein